jgi:hypothetical protein
MPVALTRPRRFLPNGIIDALVQLLVVVVAYKLYQNTRGMVDHQIGASVAFANADNVQLRGLLTDYPLVRTQRYERHGYTLDLYVFSFPFVQASPK